LYEPVFDAARPLCRAALTGHTMKRAGNMAIRGMAFTMYPVTDMPRAVAFYKDVLGLSDEGCITLDYWQEFDLDGATFGIGNFEQVGKAGTAQSLSLEIDDLPAYRAMLSSRGVDSTEPHELQYCWLSTVKDPDGNSIVLHQSKSPSA